MTSQQAIDQFRYCWICAGEFAQPCPREGDGFAVDCTTCGSYRITGTLYATAFPLPDSERYRVSYLLKQRTIDGRDPPNLTTDTFPAVIAALPDPPTHEKSGILLLSLARLHPEPGSRFRFDELRERSLACARDDQEAKFFMRYLKEERYLDSGLGPSGRMEYTLTHKGWAEAARLAAGTPIVSRRCFVALHFSDEMLAVYRDAIAPAIERAGFEPRLANEPAHNEQIDARIVAEIRQAKFVVADVTGARTGVYFEAGYALGQGRQVIWTCRADRERDMHFDTRQYNHILWRDAGDLRDQLHTRIVATI
jgi:nucleoside 2-deoxyribosyltransferase